MMLTNPQKFSALYNPNSDVRLYMPAVAYWKDSIVKGFLPGVTDTHICNFAHNDYRRGSFALPSSQLATITTNFAFSYTGAGAFFTDTGETIPIQKATDGSSKNLIVVSGIYNTAASFVFRFGASSPPLGQGNIIIDDTDVTLIYDDGSTATFAHGKSWTIGNRFFIGIDIGVATPVINLHSNTADVVSSSFISGSGQSKPITIADEVVLGGTGTPVRVSAAAIINQRSGSTATWLSSQQLYDQWRTGNYMLAPDHQLRYSDA